MKTVVKRCEKFTKEELIFLEQSVKKLMDTGNFELASIMAHNIAKVLSESVDNAKVKKIIKKEHNIIL